MHRDSLSPPPIDPASTVLLIVGRNNWKRGSSTLNRVVEELGRAGMAVLRYESRTSRTRRWLEARAEQVLMALPAGLVAGRLLTRLVKAALLLSRPDRWDYVLTRRQERHHTAAPALRRFIGSLAGRRVVLLTHSAGGIAGALVESAPPVLCHVCFGYPFQHPGRPPEPRRTEPLERVGKPFLIVQGERDEYGSADEARRRYRLSPATTVQAVADDHHYDTLAAAELEDLLRTIKAFIGLPAAGGVRNEGQGRA
ncbi:alpha/beta family hydrolase [Rubrivivax gelatinosus]|uniref:KANL3/Tex30 alpha/beta hydrolase-like domain-containing protein n=1 Tax=Rubrivivax gelatinosus TaxID=28068 RepID=A0ABS1DX64_RUBGE|nr:alpha/beta family hydrolase [Rubrivivax gelatinosus]MBK1713357.1 hypothetical protein [Rubrivivax gelatinosus]